MRMKAIAIASIPSGGQMIGILMEGSHRQMEMETEMDKEMGTEISSVDFH